MPEPVANMTIGFVGYTGNRKDRGFEIPTRTVVPFSKSSVSIGGFKNPEPVPTTISPVEISRCCRLTVKSTNFGGVLMDFGADETEYVLGRSI